MLVLEFVGNQYLSEDETEDTCSDAHHEDAEYLDPQIELFVK
jgi:hypothetical protein